MGVGVTNENLGFGAERLDREGMGGSWRRCLRGETSDLNVVGVGLEEAVSGSMVTTLGHGESILGV